MKTIFTIFLSVVVSLSMVACSPTVKNINATAKEITTAESSIPATADTAGAIATTKPTVAATSIATTEPTTASTTVATAKPATAATTSATAKPTVAATTIATTSPTSAATAIIESAVKISTAPATIPSSAATAAPTVISTIIPEESINDNYHGHVYTGGESSKKYHYEEKCAGKYSHEITWEEVESRNLGPCGTCVLK